MERRKRTHTRFGIFGIAGRYSIFPLFSRERPFSPLFIANPLRSATHFNLSLIIEISLNFAQELRLSMALVRV
jgi:hypothetical protein